MRTWLLTSLLLVSTSAVADDARLDTTSDRTHLYDVSGDVLPVGTSEFGALWGRYSRGILPRVQVSSHLVGALLGIPNVSARYQLLSRDELRASMEVGFSWVAAAMLLRGPGEPAPLLLFIPFELRGTVPLSDGLELTLAAIYRGSFTNMVGGAFSNSSLGTEARLVRYDLRGAWMLTGRFPIFSQARVRLDSLFSETDVSGTITLDDIASWGFMLSRDQTFGRTGHFRFGLGYRNTPGVILLQSIGRMTFDLALYWR